MIVGTSRRGAIATSHFNARSLAHELDILNWEYIGLRITTTAEFQLWIWISIMNCKDILPTWFFIPQYPSGHLDPVETGSSSNHFPLPAILAPTPQITIVSCAESNDSVQRTMFAICLPQLITTIRCYVYVSMVTFLWLRFYGYVCIVTLLWLPRLFPTTRSCKSEPEIRCYGRPIEPNKLDTIRFWG